MQAEPRPDQGLPPGDFLPSLAQAMHDMAESRKQGAEGGRLYVKWNDDVHKFEACRGKKGACTTIFLQEVVKTTKINQPFPQKERLDDHRLQNKRILLQQLYEGFSVLEEENRPSDYRIIHMVSWIFRKIFGTDKAWRETKQILIDLKRNQINLKNKCDVEFFVTFFKYLYSKDLQKTSPEYQHEFSTHISVLIEDLINQGWNIQLGFEDKEMLILKALEATSIWQDLKAESIIQEELINFENNYPEQAKKIMNDPQKKEKLRLSAKKHIVMHYQKNVKKLPKPGQENDQKINSRELWQCILAEKTVVDLLTAEDNHPANQDDVGGYRAEVAGKVERAAVAPQSGTPEHLNAVLRDSSTVSGFFRRAKERNGVLLESLKKGVKPDREAAIAFLRQMNGFIAANPQKELESFVQELLKTCMSNDELVLPKDLFYNQNRGWQPLGKLYYNAVALDLLKARGDLQINEVNERDVNLKITTTLMFQKEENIQTLSEMVLALLGDKKLGDTILKSSHRAESPLRDNLL